MTALPARSQVRAEFAALLNAGLVGTGKPLQEVFGYVPKDTGGKTPVAALGSAGTRRTPFTARGSRPGYLLELWIFVLYAAVDEDGTLIKDTAGAPVWDEQDSQTALDLIEAEVRELIDNNQKGANWKTIEYNADTDASVLPLGDQSYRAELIPLRFEVF